MLSWYQKNRGKIFGVYALGYVAAVVVMLFGYIPREIRVDEVGDKIVLGAPVAVEPVREATVATGISKLSVGEKQEYVCKLFGVFPVGNMTATVRKGESVGAVGSPVGIYLKMQNVLVAGTKEIKNSAGVETNPGQYIVKEGDYVAKVDGEAITCKEDLQQKVRDSSGNPMVFTILRNNEYMDVRLQPVLAEDGNYKLGLWVKDDMAGVGTLTYVKEDGAYGALGHGISEGNTEELLPLDHGYLYHTSITNLTPSSIGSPGEITGLISYGTQNRYGDVKSNSPVGIFGTVSDLSSVPFEKKNYPVGYKQEVQREEASLLFGMEDKVKDYDIMIDQINYDAKEKNKSFVFHVTDEKLISQTGGIVQGMSGSPIIQNGRIVGAVTHVFVNDPTKGYGIFIEDMLER